MTDDRQADLIRQALGNARSQIDRLESDLETARNRLRSLVPQGYDAGLSVAEMGKVLGLTRQRVDVLRKGQ